MRTEAERCEWQVGSPTGDYVRVHYEGPSGSHFLTPEHIRARYLSEVHDSALVVWYLPGCGLAGVRAGIDEVTWNSSDVALFEISFTRPGKGSGYVGLEGLRSSGQRFGILSSDRYNEEILAWHLAAAKLFERIFSRRVHPRDDGCDV